MAGVNKVILIGNLGANPELRYTSTGTAVTELRLATSRKYTNKTGGQETDTQWHRVVVWGKQAELCRDYLSKGKQVYIEGRLQTRQWEDRDGNKRYTTEVVCEQIQFIGSRNGGTENSNDAPPPDDRDAPNEMKDDDIPF